MFYSIWTSDIHGLEKRFCYVIQKKRLTTKRHAVSLYFTG